MTEPELKPCPFCGTSSKVAAIQYDSWHWVACDRRNCIISGPQRKSKVAAIKAWDAAWVAKQQQTTKTEDQEND